MASPAGSVSVSAAPVSATPLGLVSVSVTVDAVPPPWRFVGANALTPVTGRSAATVSVAFAFCGFVPCDDATAPAGMLLMNTPAAGDSTSTVTVHWPATPPDAAGIVPPESEKLPAPGIAVTAPPHEVVAFAGLATTTVPGSASVNAVPVAAAGLLLRRKTVSVETWPAETLIGLKVLLTPTAAKAAGAAMARASPTARSNRNHATRCRTLPGLSSSPAAIPQPRPRAYGAPSRQPPTSAWMLAPRGMAPATYLRIPGARARHLCAVCNIRRIAWPNEAPERAAAATSRGGPCGACPSA